jgi:hypothetical protein
MATCAGICRSRQNAAIRSSVGGDAAAYNTSAEQRSAMSPSTSSTEPRFPRLPSAVTISIVWDSRFPSMGLNTRSKVSPPTIMSTRLWRAISSWAKK